LYVDNPGDFFITNDQGAAGLDNGDTVDWNPGLGGSHSPQTGLIFGTDAFGSIQAAVTAATAGDTINVAGGTFSELVNVNKSLLLRGNQFGVDARLRVAPAETVVNGNAGTTSFFVTANDVTLDGFTVEGQTNVNQFGAGIVLGANTSGAHVVNNIVHNNVVGLFLTNALGGNQAVISQNRFENNNNPGAASGNAIYTDQFVSGGAVDNVLIDSNAFINNGNPSNGGAALGFSSTDPARPTTNVTISNNEFTGNARAMFAFNLQDSQFVSNTVSGSNWSASADLRLFEGTSNLLVHENVLTGGAGRALRITNAGTGLSNATGVTFTSNSVTGYTGPADTFSLEAGQYTGPLDATGNWWDDITGPTTATNPGGAGAGIADPDLLVDFQPWLVYSPDADPAAPGVQFVSSFTVPAQVGGFTSTNNNYRRLVNVVDLLRDGQTASLSGDFDWTEANAAAAWALGNDGVANTADDYSLLVRPNLNNVTITAASLGAATIQGPGDLAAVNLEGVFTFDGGDNQNWTISNLEILDFDLAIGMFSGAGGADAYSGTVIANNRIRVPADLNTTAAPADVNQNIGIHFSFGQNQTIQGNTIEIDGAGVSDGTNLSSTVGMQSNTSGGNVYDGLVIDSNIINVFGAQSASPARILGIWENAHGHSSNITVSNNQFNNLDAGNNPAINLQRAFRVTSHSGATSTVNYSNNTVNGANIGFEWITGSNFTGNQAVRLVGNTLTNTHTGVLVQSNGVANLFQNTITGSGAAGVHVQSGMLTAAGAVPNAVQENVIAGGAGDGIRIEATAGAIGAIFNNDLSGHTGLAINNLTAGLVDASGNYYGTSDPAGVGAEVSANVDYTPWLNGGADTDAGTPGFQGDFSSLGVDDNSPQTGSTGRIQEAVNRLTDGALTGANRTINVAAGVYSELVNVNKPLTLLGAQAGVDARTRAVPPADESVVNGNAGTTSFFVTANDVTIDGFTVEGQTNVNQFGAGIVLGAGTSGAQVRNNIVQDNVVGLFLANAAGGNQAIVERNVFRFNDNLGAANGNGIYNDVFVSGGTLTNVLIQDNLFAGANFTRGVNLQDATGITITNNQFTDGNAVSLRNVDDSTISSNQFTGVMTGFPAVTALTVTNNGFNFSDNVTVTGNTFTDRAASAISVSNRGSNLVLTNNTITQDVALFGAGTNRSMISLTGLMGVNNVSENTITLSGIMPVGSGVNGISVQGNFTETVNLTANVINGGNTDAPGVNDSYGIGIFGGGLGLPTPIVSVINVTNNFVNGFVDAIASPNFLNVRTTVRVNENDLSGNALMTIRADTTPQSNPIDASRNWHGVAGAAAVAARVVGVVDYTPSLNFGTDVSAAAGFQGDFSSLTAHATGQQIGAAGRIQEAVDLLTDGILTGANRIINAGAGTFTENVLVNKSVQLLGANAGVNPNTGVRGPESIVVPGAVETSVQSNTSGTIFRVGTALGHSDVTIDGFLIDGHNAALSGGRVLNGVEVHTGAGIISSTGSFDDETSGFDVTLTVHNNIIQNLERYGVYVSGVNSGAQVLAGNDVSFNKIDNLPSGNNFGGDRGRGTAFGWDVYGTFSNNVVTRVNVGWQDDNHFQASTGAGTLVDGNEIHAYHRGIFHNLQYGTATAATIANNDVFVETNGDFAASSTNFGIEIASIMSAVDAFVTDNNVTGTVHGIRLWNLPTTGNVLVSGGTLTGNEIGILATNNDPQFGSAGANTSAVISGVAISGATGSGIHIQDDPSATGDVHLTIENDVDVSGSPTGILVGGIDASATIQNNDGSIHTNTVGIDVDAGTASIVNNAIYNNGIGLRVVNGGTVTALSDIDFFGTADNSIDVQVTPTAGLVAFGNDLAFRGELFFLDLQSTQSVDLTALSGITFDETDNFRIEDKMHHRVDTDLALTNGLVTWVVGNIFVTTPGGGSTDSSIQRGVDAASAGNTVNIEAGTYAEAVNVNKPNLTLDGATNVATDVVIDPAAGDGIAISGHNVTVRDLRVTGAATGISASGVVGPTLTNVRSDSNTGDGVALSNVTGITALTDVVAMSNSGRGLDVSGAETLSVNGGSFSNNANDGLSIIGVTAATLTNVAANANIGIVADGLEAANVASLIVTGGTFNLNSDEGIDLLTGIGAGTLTGVTMSVNGGRGLAVGESGGGATTLDLSDLTILGNAQNSAINNVSQLNFTGSTGIVRDDITINGDSVQHTRDPLGTNVVNQTIALNNVASLDVFGDDGNDNFVVTPSLTMNIDVHGGNPAAFPGDNFKFVPPLGQTATFVFGPFGSGTVQTTGGYQDVDFDGIESLATTGAVAINGTGDDDLLEVSATASDEGSMLLTVDYTGENGGPFAAMVLNFTALTSLTFNSLGGDDLLKINNPAGTVFAPSSGIDYNAGGQIGDALENLGGSAASGNYTPGPTDDAGTLTHDSGPADQTIAFTGLATATDTVTEASFTVAADDGANDIGVDNGTATGDGLIRATIDARVPIQLANKTDLVIDGGSPADAAVDAFSINFTEAATGLGVVHLNGIGGADTFDVIATAVPTHLNGGAGNDTVTFGAGASLSGGTIDGGAGSDSIVGNDAAHTYTLTGPDAGNISDLVPNGFTSVENLTAGTANDLFLFANGGSLAGAINGGGGIDTIDGDDAGRTFNVNGTNAGNVSGILPAGFTNVESLVGGNGADLLIISASGNLAGSFDGLSGSDRADLSALAVQQIVVTGLGGVDGFNTTGGTRVGDGLFNIDVLNGSASGGTDRLTGRDGDATWQVKVGADQTFYQDVGTGRRLVFTLFEELFGGSQADAVTVDFSTGNPVSGVGLTVNGQDGADSLKAIGTAVRDEFDLSTLDLRVNGIVIRYSNLETMEARGGAGNDAFRSPDVTLPAALTLVRYFGETGNDSARVTPATLARFHLDGGPGSDTFRMDREGAVLKAPIPPSGAISGTYFFTNRKQIDFFSFETRFIGVNQVSP
jgi:nitrous oxidase accessory protein NosD